MRAPNEPEFHPEGETFEDSSNFLATYFKEMAQLPVLHPEEEYAIAERISVLETNLWIALLSYTPLCHALLTAVETEMKGVLPEFRTLRRVAAKASSQGHTTDPRLVHIASQIAEKMREKDIDRLFVGAALTELSKQPATAFPLSFVSFFEEVSRVQRQLQTEKNAFVKANLRLVVSIARRFNHGRMPLPDLIQEGNIGLIKAVERFDYRKGFRFSTYASWWIRHAISRGLADKGRAVRLPVHMIDVYHRLARARKELSAQLGRLPTDDELSHTTGLAIAKIEKMNGYLFEQSLSLDRNIGDGEGRRFIETLEDHSVTAKPAEQFITASLSTEVHRLLGHLKPIEADILRQRFGLYTDQEQTLKDVGEKYNLSRERIRQLQEQALLKMRRALTQNEK